MPSFDKFYKNLNGFMNLVTPCLFGLEVNISFSKFPAVNYENLEL